MEKLRCDRRVKCRTVSSSLTSGRTAGRVRRNCWGRSAMADAGNSSGHWSVAPRPECEYSKITFSWSFSWVRIGNPSGGTHGGLHGIAERRDITIDIAQRLRLGSADEQRITQLGERVGEVQAAQDSAARECCQDGCHRAVEQQDRLVEEWTRERTTHSLYRSQGRHEILGTGVRGSGCPLEACRAHQ